MTATSSLRAWQLRIVSVAWLTYAGYYLGRANLSTGIPGLRGELGLSAQTAGWLATGFFLTYALGQLVSGYLGNRVSPRWLVFTGMVVSAGLNILFGFLSLPGLLLLAWSANGFFQALGWAPILKLLANWHSREERRRISGLFTTSFVAGSAATLLLAGWLAGAYGWRWAFWLPGALMAGLALVWFFAVRDAPNSVRHQLTSNEEPAPRSSAANPLGALRTFWPVALASAFGGFLLFGLVVWTPSLLVDTLQLGVGSASRLATLLPIAGIVGTLGTGWLIARRMAGRAAITAAVLLFALAGLVLLFPLATTSPVTSAALLALVGAAAYGTSSVLISTLPLILSRRRETASVAASIDFAFNLGASLGGVLIGVLVDRAGWGAVFVVLAVAAALAGGVLLVASGRLRPTPDS